MFSWINRKIIKPVVKKVEKVVKSPLGKTALAVGAAVTGAPAIAAAAKTIGTKVVMSEAAKTAVITGGANLAGAVLTRNDAKKENNRVLAANKAEAQRVQKVNEQAVEKAQKQNTEVRENYYKNVVEDAQAAGINPLTALRTGGGAGYSTAVAGTMSNAVLMEGVYTTPTLSRNPLAAGIESTTNTYLQEMTRQKQYKHESRMDELNRALKIATLKSMKADLTRSNLPTNVNDKDPFFSDPYADLTTNELDAVVAAEVKPVLKTYVSTKGNTFQSVLSHDETLESALLAAQSVLVDAGHWAGMRPEHREVINAKIWNPINERIKRFLGY